MNRGSYARFHGHTVRGCGFWSIWGYFFSKKLAVVNCSIASYLNDLWSICCKPVTHWRGFYVCLLITKSEFKIIKTTRDWATWHKCWDKAYVSAKFNLFSMFPCIDNFVKIVPSLEFLCIYSYIHCSHKNVVKISSLVQRRQRIRQLLSIWSDCYDLLDSS